MDMIVTILITITAVGTSFLVSFLLEKFGGRRRIKEIQDEINKINKEYGKALKDKDEKKLKILEEKMKEFPKLLMESTILNFKGLIIVLPVIMIVPTIIRSVFPDFLIELPFSLPVPRLKSDQLIEIKNTFGPYGWFWLSFIFIGGFFQLIYSKIKQRNSKSSMKTT